MNWLKGFFSKKTEITKNINSNNDESVTYRGRGSKTVEASEGFKANISNDFNQMLEAVNSKSDLVDRHFLLQTIISESYKKRNEDVFKEYCLKYSDIYLSEVDSLLTALKKEYGDLPRVTIFQNYSTLLVELKQYDKAIKICEIAISFGLKDGTKGGFESRIEKIKRI
jgi:hypothetical protein